MNINDEVRFFSIMWQVGPIPLGGTPPLGLIWTFSRLNMFHLWKEAWEKFVSYDNHFSLLGPDGQKYIMVDSGYLNGSQTCWCQKDGVILVDKEVHFLQPFWRVGFSIRTVEENGFFEIPVDAKIVWASKKPSRRQYFQTGDGEIIIN